MADADQPWLVGSFEATPAFAQFSDLFAHELTLVERDAPMEIDRWEETYRPISERLTLVRPDGTAVAEFLLHINGGEAWFRYSDEPFK